MTSPKLRALLEQIASGKIVTDKAKILDFIVRNPGQNYVLIGKYLNLPQKTISGRLSELEDLGAIRKEDKGGTFSSFYPCTLQTEQEYYRDQRERTKLKQWAKRGLNMEIAEDLKDQLKNIIKK